MQSFIHSSSPIKSFFFNAAILSFNYSGDVRNLNFCTFIELKTREDGSRKIPELIRCSLFANMTACHFS